MAWLRVDDQALNHVKYLLLIRLCKGDSAKASSVFGDLTLLGSWSASQYTDAFLLETLVYRHCGPRAPEWMGLAVKAGMAHKHRHPILGPGWLLDTSDQLWHIMSKEERDLGRAARARRPKKALQLQILYRDGDMCRFCAMPTNVESDHKSDRSREFEHLDPEGDPTDIDNVVIACRRCNREKARRTPADAGMLLLPPPRERGDDDLPFYLDETRTSLVQAGWLPARPSDSTRSTARREVTSQPERGSASSGYSQPQPPALPADPIAGPDGRSVDPRYAVSGSVGTGMDGAGRSGSGQAGTGAAALRRGGRAGRKHRRRRSA